ncbi:CRISPR associated protein Csc3 [Candidatus Magnetomorum sp. HK-1]|nr:CRISPR associated protein Csc3 [Candidatus Magnetomorum sp. HK-1]
MAENTETLILKLLEDEISEERSSHLMELLLNKGIHMMPDILQFGDKQNQTLKAHTQNVMCFCYQLADILDIDDTAKMNLITASLLHDINKYDEYKNLSYKDVATQENISKHLNFIFEDSSDDFDICITTIQTIMKGHSGHMHCNAAGLDANNNNALNNLLIAIIQAADILDLSHDFHEIEKKEKALRLINQQVNDFQYDYTWHYFSDNRGLYTNFIHNIIVSEYQKKGAIPLLFYPEGVWYLKDRSREITVDTQTIAMGIQQEMDKLSSKDTSRLVKDSKGTAMNFIKNPFALKFSPEAVMDILVKAILAPKEKKYVDKYEKLVAEDCLQKLSKTFLKEKASTDKQLIAARMQYRKFLSKNNIPENWSEADECFQSLSPALRKKLISLKQKLTLLKNTSLTIDNIDLSNHKPETLFSSDIEVMHMGMLVGSFAYLLINYVTIDKFPLNSSTAWNLTLEAAGVDPNDSPELMIFDKQSNRAFRTATIFYKQGIGFEILQNRYLDYLKKLNLEYLYQSASQVDPALTNYVNANFQTKNLQLKIDNQHLQQYMAGNHKQCSHCSSGQGHELMAGNLPKGIKPQLFSNRLKGGGGEPKRNVCIICNQGFFWEKILHESYDNHYYLHLFADGGEHRSHAAPNIFLEALKNGIQALQHSDCRSFLIQPNVVVKKYLDNKLPDLIGSPKKGWGILVPKFSQGICGQITIGINPPGKESNESIKFIFALFHLLMLTDYFHLRGILSRSSIPPLKANEFDSLYIDHVPLAFTALIQSNNISATTLITLKQKFFGLYAMRNTYGMDDKELHKLAKTLFDPTGLELIHYLKKAYAGTERTREKPPWIRVWPHIQLFIEEEKLMPIKKLAEIALNNHFHGQSFKETSQAKPLDLAFDALSKHQPPESKEDLKMVMLHDVSRGLERLSRFGQLKKENYEAVETFVTIFFDQIFMQQYKGDKTKIIKMQKRIRSAFIGYLNVIRKNNK